MIQIVTIFKSAMPVAILLFAFAFRLQKPSIRLSLIICTIVTGTALAVVHDIKTLQLPPVAALVMTTSVLFGGLRWTLTALLLKKKDGSPLYTMTLLAPAMSVCLLCISLLAGEASSYNEIMQQPRYLWFLMIGGGT